MFLHAILCHMPVVNCVTSKCQTRDKVRLFFQKPAKSCNIDKFTAGLTDCHEGFQFILWLHVYLSVFFFFWWVYCMSRIYPYLSWKGLFLRTPLPPKLSGNSNKLHKFFKNFWVLQNAYPNPKEIPIPSVEGGGDSTAIFWNCTISSANSSVFMFLNVSWNNLFYSNMHCVKN